MTGYRDNPEYAALLDTVLACPADDAPRGIMADWIEEHGGDALAEFIRRQLAAPDWRVEWVATAAGEWVGNRDGDSAANAIVHDMIVSGMLAGWQPGGMLAFRRGFIEDVRLPCPIFMVKAVLLFFHQPVVRVRLTDKQPMRGMNDVWCWTGPADYTKERFAIPPELVEWLRRRPTSCYGPTPGWVWFDSEAEAISELSAACLAHGRERAGLPPLQVR